MVVRRLRRCPTQSVSCFNSPISSCRCKPVSSRTSWRDLRYQPACLSSCADLTAETFPSSSYAVHLCCSWFPVSVRGSVIFAPERYQFNAYRVPFVGPRTHCTLLLPHSAFLYSGLSRRKSALHLIWIVSASNAVAIFQWYFWGYSLAFSSTATNGFIGNLHNFGMKGVLANPSPGSPLLPELLYSFYQMEFACVTVAILMGALAERGRVMPALVFSFLWLTLVYCPLACWAWAPGGWGFKWGVLDYAGSSGFLPSCMLDYLIP